MSEQVSPDELMGLVIKYENAVKELNEAIDRATHANHSLIIAKADVSKCKHCVELIQEQIRVSKQLLNAGR